METPTKLNFEDFKMTISEPLVDMKVFGSHPVGLNGNTPFSSLREVSGLQTVGFNVTP